jgi:hypothetical protein
VSTWTEAELARKRKLRRPGPGRVVHWRDQRRSRFVEATNRAGVLGGQLAERAGFLEETLAAMARAWC